MPVVTYTDEDVKRGVLPEPDWYICVIKDITEEQSKDKQSINWIVDLVGSQGEAEGVPLRRYFNSKSRDRWIKFVEAVLNQEIKHAGSTNTDDLIGMRVKVFISRGEFDGEPRNEAKKFAPADDEAAA